MTTEPHSNKYLKPTAKEVPGSDIFGRQRAVAAGAVALTGQADVHPHPARHHDAPARQVGGVLQPGIACQSAPPEERRLLVRPARSQPSLVDGAVLLGPAAR
eukprot:scaffold27915_cov101-Isochrysis_galbana.AAC.1